jgi:hypothetical protein
MPMLQGGSGRDRRPVTGNNPMSRLPASDRYLVGTNNTAVETMALGIEAKFRRTIPLAANP